MTPETATLLADWKATYGELNKGRNPDLMQYTDAMEALAVLLRREIVMLRQPTVTHCPTRHADGLPAARTAKPSAQRGSPA